MGPGGKFLHGADAKFFHQYQNKRETNKITYNINIFSYRPSTKIHKYANVYECKNVQKLLNYLAEATGKTGKIS